MTMTEARPTVPVAPLAPTPKRPRARGMRSAGPKTYLMLALALLLSALPVVWTMFAASHTQTQIFEPGQAFVPGYEIWRNIDAVFSADAVNFRRALVNSLIVSTTVTLSVLFLSSLAGFAFAKLRFRGKNLMFGIVVATMMVPVQLGLIPLYILIVKAHWVGHLQAVIVPCLVTGFGVFFMRQFIADAVPNELVEASRIDGCSTARIYWHVILPAIRPAAAVLGLLTFMQTWNDFLWPIVALSPGNPTVQVAIRTLAAGYYTNYPLVLTGAALAVLPLIVVFVIFGKQIVGGIMEGAVKG